MVYINRDGQVHNKRPWSLSLLFSMFIGFFTAIYLFIRSLIDPFTNGTTSTTDRRSFWGGGGGGGGGGGSDGRPPRPPRRPMGRITHLSDVTVPGGCSGGSCGR